MFRLSVAQIIVETNACLKVCARILDDTVISVKALFKVRITVLTDKSKKIVIVIQSIDSFAV